MTRPRPATAEAGRALRACLGVGAALALLGLLLFTLVDTVSAAGRGGGGGGFSRGGGGGGGSFGRSGGGGSFGRGGGFSRGSFTRSSAGGSRMGGRRVSTTRMSSGRSAQAGRGGYGRSRHATSRGARSTRMGGNRTRTTRYPNRATRTGTKTTGGRTQRTATGGTGTSKPPTKTNPPTCRGRNCGGQAGNNPRPGEGTKPPSTGCRGGYCPPGGDGKPPQGHPPRRPPHYPPVVVGGGGTPPYYPPVPPYGGNPPPPSVGGGGGGQPPRQAGGGGGGGGGGPARVARLAPGKPTAPPAGENRYVPDQVICVLRDDLTEAQIDEFLSDNAMERTGAGGDVRIGVLGVRVFRFRITDGRSVPQVMAVLAQDPRGVTVQPNYVYQLSEMPRLQQQVTPRYRTQSGAPARAGNYSMQYVIAKLQLLRAHELTRGERVLIAVIDSGIDVTHPEIVGQVLRSIDVTEDQDQSPHSHGTAMAGAIVSHGSLMGVAPGASILAIRAFSPRSRTSGQGTSMHIAIAIDRATQEGARIINMSLAGPHDPMVQKAVEEARARGIVLIAAAGNNGPKAPPAYPAAYPQVIAVTATDSNDHIYTGANRGTYIAVAAPGVDVMVASPNRAYTMTTGTSVAAAHISGIVALMLSRNPMLDPDMVRELLVRSVRAAGGDVTFGAGFADAYAAVTIVDPARIVIPVAGGPPSQ